jgi:hypothetical protein
MEVTYRRPPWLTGSYHPRSAQHRAELPDDGRIQQAGPGPPPPPPTARQLASLPVSAPVWQPYGGPRQLLPRLTLEPALSIRAHFNRIRLRQPCAPIRARSPITNVAAPQMHRVLAPMVPPWLARLAKWSVRADAASAARAVPPLWATLSRAGAAGAPLPRLSRCSCRSALLPRVPQRQSISSDSRSPVGGGARHCGCAEDGLTRRLQLRGVWGGEMTDAAALGVIFCLGVLACCGAAQFSIPISSATEHRGALLNRFGARAPGPGAHGIRAPAIGRTALALLPSPPPCRLVLSRRGSDACPSCKK